MTDATLALQKSLVAILTADEDLAELVAGRVYDQVPASAAYPLIEIADGQTIDAGAEGIDGVEAFLDVHVWSQAVGAVECRRIAGLVRLAVHQADPLLDEGAWRLVELRHRQTRFLSDPDGITTHAVITFRALIDPA